MNAHFFRTLAKSAIATSLLTLLTASPLQAQVPQLINYQGRVTVGATNFDGVSQFEFALVKLPDRGDGGALIIPVQELAMGS